MTNQPLPEPRRLTPEDIEAFKKAYEKDWGEQLSEKDAVILAGNILELYRRLSKLETPPASEPSKSSEEPKELKQGTLF